MLPGVRFACDAYVALCRESPLVVAVASSLTEMFAPDLMSRRIAAWEQHYPWVGAEALGYFRARVPRARRDGEEGAGVRRRATRPRARCRRPASRRWCARRRSCGTCSTACRRRRAAERAGAVIGLDTRVSLARKARLARSALGPADAALPGARPRAERHRGAHRGALSRGADGPATSSTMVAAAIAEPDRARRSRTRCWPSCARSRSGAC